MRVAILAMSCLWLAACAPRLQPPRGEKVHPSISEDYFMTDDGVKLPLRVWRPPKPERAVILALHGFNDYSNAFAMPAEYWARSDILLYAYDQRGFGETPHRGLWPGSTRLARDAQTFLRLLRERHECPIYLLGSSMGGAVAMLVLAGMIGPDNQDIDRDQKVSPDGVILIAPAIWGRRSMPFYQTALLWLTAHTVPWMKVSGRGLGILPSDNIPMLRALGRDPLMIRSTRIDAVWGLVNLMDQAEEAVAHMRGSVLLLYGDHDQLIPKAAMQTFIHSLPPDLHARVAIYPSGYHMLLRDLQANLVWNDILSWIIDKNAPLSSGEDVQSQN